MACLLASMAAATTAALSGCGAPAEVPAGGRDSEAEQFLLTSLGGSTDLRHTHLRCFRVRGPWTDACTFQVVSPRQGRDDPLLVLGLQFADHGVASSTGTVPLDIACANHLRCWVRALCAATHRCDLGTGAFEPDPAHPIRLRTPTPTESRCVSAWNAHGGFSPAEVAQEAPMLASGAVARPVYTPHLSGASLGFIGARAEVRATGQRCSVLFQTGAEEYYEVTAEARGETRFWLWQGARNLTTGAAPVQSWNACQREDGTLFLSTSCPPVEAVPRRVADELERGYLQTLADAGGIPYWLGQSFADARPVPVLPPSRGAQSAVEYANAAGGINLLVLTYRPPDRRLRTKGVIVARAEPETATVLVVADREVPAELRRGVRDALRPFIATDPDAEQLPGDVEEEPTRIDTSAPVITHWVGPRFEGFEAAVVADAPAGAGVVRYSKGDVQWFLVSYTPLPKKHCARVGCASPPPLPRSLKQYGEVRDTILDEPIIVVLTRQPKKVPHIASIYEAVEPLQ